MPPSIRHGGGNGRVDPGPEQGHRSTHWSRAKRTWRQTPPRYDGWTLGTGREEGPLTSSNCDLRSRGAPQPQLPSRTHPPVAMTYAQRRQNRTDCAKPAFAVLAPRRRVWTEQPRQRRTHDERQRQDQQQGRGTRGKAKETLGAATDDRDLQAEGQTDQRKATSSRPAEDQGRPQVGNARRRDGRPPGRPSHAQRSQGTITDMGTRGAIHHVELWVTYLGTAETSWGGC